MTLSFLPDDPLFPFQWYLQNTPTTTGQQPMDLDLGRAWADYRGRGVNIGVVEINPVELGHPDLPASFPRFAAALGGPPAAEIAGPHPTAVAGIALGRWNGIGIAGIAPGAGLGSYTVANGEAAAAFAAALADGMHILNNSWGGDGRRFEDNPGDAAIPNIQALQQAATTGRDGLGAIIVWSGGNERAIGSDSGLYGPTASRFTIAVGALERDGTVAPYSSPGANLLVSTFGGPAGEFRHDLPGDRIASTDLTGRQGYNTRDGAAGDHTYAFDGTSAAAPMVSGVVALMLEANPLLGYRQVHEILAMTARIPDPSALQLTSNGSNGWNGGGSVYSRDSGFGVVDAHGAVRVAEAMRAVRTEARGEFLIQSQDVAGTIIGGAVRFAVPQFLVERVEVLLDATIPVMSQTVMSLRTSSSSQIDLLQRPAVLSTVNHALQEVTNTGWPAGGWTLQTPAFWGNTGGNNWTLDVSSAGPVTINSATLRLWGQGADAGQTYHFTDDISTIAAREGRDLFVFPHASREVTFNGAALSGAMELTFVPAESGFTAQRINGVTVQTSPGENWRHAWGGDGDDRFTGNAADNIFYGGRGNNTLSGGEGTDVAAFLGSRALHAVFSTAEGQLVVGRGGSARLDGIERLRFEEGELRAGDATDAALVAASFYGALLERVPDRAGFEAWQAVLNEGLGRDAMALRQAAQGFLDSAEFAALHGAMSDGQFVAMLYDGFFGRTGDVAGALGWEAALGAGASRADVVAGFVLADEFQTVTMARLADQMIGWMI